MSQLMHKFVVFFTSGLDQKINRMPFVIEDLV